MKVYDQCVLSMQTYGAKTLTLAQKSVNKKIMNERGMECVILEINLRDRIPNEYIRIIRITWKETQRKNRISLVTWLGPKIDYGYDDC